MNNISEKAIKLKMPVGRIACPHCGSVKEGLLYNIICPICGNDMFTPPKQTESFTFKKLEV